jgi:sirohydrochlorin cobaltochelatase
MHPTLDEAIDAAVAGRAKRVLVVPLFLAPGGHTTRDLPALLESARARHPALAIRATSSIGEEAGVLAALADWIARAAA